MLLSMDAQSQAAMYAATFLRDELRKLGKPVEIVRLPETNPSSDQAGLLQLDSASTVALKLMKRLGNVDGIETYRWCQDADNDYGKLLTQIFERMTEDRTNPQRTYR